MERRPLTPYVPLLLSVALVAGVFIGQEIGGSGPLTVLRFHQPSAADKVGQVLDLIDRHYVDSVEKDALVEDVLQDILQKLDPHSYYISAAELQAAQEPLEGSFDGIGVEFAIQHDTVVVVATVEGGPSAALGIKAGDRILKADSILLAGVGITNEGVTKALRGPEGSEVEVTLARRGRPRPFQVMIERGKIPIHSVAVALLHPDGTGYIKLIRFAKHTHRELVEAASALRQQGMKRLVLDLRGNGGGFLEAAYAIADEFLPAGRNIVYTEGRSSPRRDLMATAEGSFEDIPLAVLIDENSASASEIVAGAIQDNDRGPIVGRRSFGKGLVQEHKDLPDHSAVRITTARYYTPSGRSIQKPYGEGVDYEAEYENRFAHGELLSADSVPVDSSQVFHTVNGRTVFGGGGIMPDIFVAADTSEGSQYLTDLFFSGVLNQVAFDIADRDRAQLLAFGSYKAFAQRYTVGAAQFSELAEAARKEGIAVGPEDQARSKQQISIRLKAGIARNLWGDPGFYTIVLDTDRIYEEARSSLLNGGLSALR